MDIINVFEIKFMMLLRISNRCLQLKDCNEKVLENYSGGKDDKLFIYWCKLRDLFFNRDRLQTQTNMVKITKSVFKIKKLFKLKINAKYKTLSDYLRAQKILITNHKYMRKKLLSHFDNAEARQ